jgi:transcriptional regulator with XRE-family HTH domain
MSPRSFKPDPSLAPLGTVVKTLRREQGLTQKRLAEQAGTHHTYISHIERGAANLSWTALCKLARGLGVRRSVLVRRVERLERQR